MIHGDRDTLVPVDDARDFVERLRAVSERPVRYIELPAAEHAFDLWPSERTARIAEGIGRFLTAIAAARAGSTGPRLSGSIRIGDPGPRPSFPGPWGVPHDIRDEWRARRRGPFPPGETRPSLKNTWRFRHDVLNLLRDCYAEHGPIFGIRIIFGYNLALIGPEANHFMLVSGRENFGWRNGAMGHLLPLIGDGLLTTDGDYHDASRAILMPAFHRERIEAAASVMRDEAAAAVDALPAGRDHRHLRVGADAGDADRDAGAVRLRPRLGAGRRRSPAHFERGLSFHGREYPMQLLFGPGTPLAQLRRDRAALEQLVGAEIARRRERGTDGGGHPLLAARLDRRGGALAQRPAGARPRADAALRRPRHGDLDGQLPRLRARPQPGLGRRDRRRARARSAARATRTPRSSSRACRC